MGGTKYSVLYVVLHGVCGSSVRIRRKESNTTSVRTEYGVQSKECQMAG